MAFLEASTFTPLAGVTAGLTQTDSLFNLQQDGTVRFSNRVTLSTGTLSGSTLDLTQPVIVDIDLTGIAVGAGARLSFDLLGFGDRTSTITIDNVLLTDGQPTAAPVAVNDSYTVAEGGTLLSTQSSGLLSNDTDANTSLLGVSALLVTGPQHGTLILNADGSFTYQHHGSETVTDAFTYRVSDGINFSNIATVSFTITPTNDAPSIPAIAAQSVEQGRTLTFTVAATDPDDSNLAPESNVLTYSIGTGAPAGASINPSTGVFTWSVPRTQTVGLYQITVTVTDQGTGSDPGSVPVPGSASATFMVTVLELTNTPPTLNPIGAKTVNEQAELRFTISATDSDIPTQVLTYSATGLPSGATFDAATRQFSWTPTEAQGPGSYQVTFSVTDGVATTSEAVTITVGEVNVAPVLAPIGNKSVNEESEIRFTLHGSDADVPAQTLIYSATGLPTGATFDAVTREFVWTPTEAQGPGTFTVTFSVTDGLATSSEAVTITVTEVNQAPVLAPIGPKSVNEGSLLTFTALGSDADLPVQTLTYSLAAGAPAGATIHATTGVFSWTPADGPGASPYNVTVLVSDGIATASQTFTVTVNNVAPTATLTLPSPAVAGVDLPFSGVIGDVGTADTLHVSWNFGNGVVTPFQAAARGTVTTTHQYAAAGTYTVTLTVRDHNGAQTTASGSLTVAANGLVTDPWDATKTALVINGTNVGDNITVAPSGAATLLVRINASSFTFARPTGRIIVHGWGGGDNITINSTLTLPTLLFGDSGGDYLTGGAGPNVILGGTEGDNLTGGAGRDILIGGRGGDNLTGNGGDDLLIAGTTLYETNLAGLCAITNEWLRTDRTYSQRVSHLLNGGGLNGTTRLNATTVFDDAVGDNLTGNAGTDWFFGKTTLPGQDNISFVAGETITTPGTPLLVKGGEWVDGGSRTQLTNAQLAPIVQEAKARWTGTGLTSSQHALLTSLTWQIADLNGAMLGVTAGTTINVDTTAAGHGWFLYVTPKDNAEFRFVKGLAAWIADAQSQASEHVDLLTVVMHEIGHVLGFEHPTGLGVLPTDSRPLSGARHIQHLMNSELATGTRLSPVLSSTDRRHDEEKPLFSSKLDKKVFDTENGLPRFFQHVKPIILDRDVDSGHDTVRDKVVKTKGSWLSRFVSRFSDLHEEDHPNHKIEVTLSDKK